MERAEFDKWKPKEVARLLALVETERRYYQEIVASIPVSLVVVSESRNVVSANRQFRIRTGRKNEELLGRPLADALPIDGLDPVLTQVLQSSAATPRQEFYWQDRPVNVTAMPLRNWEEDSEAEVLLVIEDSAGAAATLPASQRKALDITRDIDGMLWEVDYAAGGITYVSEGAEALFGYPAARWLEDTSVWGLRVASSDRARVDAFYDQISSSPGLVFSIEFLASHAEGHAFWVRETVRVTRDDQGRPLRLAGLSVDISERRELESQQTLAVKSDALQRLSARLAHDLNNLLMIIAGYGEEMKNSLPDEHPLHHDMQQIIDASQRVYALTTQFQTYTRKPHVQATPGSVPALLSGMRPRLEHNLGLNVRLDLDLPEDLARARMDTSAMEDALSSLTRLAGLRMQGSPGRLEISACNVLRGETTGVAGSLAPGAYVRLTLTPSAPAFPEAWVEPWLEPDEAAREAELGVAGAYQILRQSGGDVAIDGNRLHLYLEAQVEVEAPAEPAPPAPVPIKPAEPEVSLETILVVEDEGGIRALVRKILKRQGYEVLEAAGGDEALAVLSSHGHKIDLLLTDVMMPGMNGVELSQRALANHNRLKVLFVSGYTDESVLEAGQFPAGTAFLQKPFTLGSLLGKVREVLDGGTAARLAAS